MNETLQAIILALIAMIGFGVNNGVAKKYAGIVGPLKLIAYPRIFVVIVLAILTITTWQDVVLDWSNIVLGIIVVIISYYGLFFFNKSVEIGDVGVVVPVSAARILVSTGVGILFLGDSLSLLQALAVLIVFLGIALLSLDFRQLQNSNLLKMSSGVPYAILCAFFWGVTLPLFGYFGNKVGVIFFTLIIEFTVFLQSIIHSKVVGKPIKLNKTELVSNLFGFLILAITGVIAGLAANAGFATGEIGIVAAISGSSPVVSVITAQVLFKEKLDLKQYFAIGLVVAGIILISLA